MTINEAIYAVFEGVGISSDDFPVRKRFVYGELKRARNELIKQELNKTRLISGESAQTLLCFPLVRTDASFCTDCDTGNYVLRSKEKLPKMVDSDFGLFLEVYLQNGVSIPKIMRSEHLSNKKRRYQLPGSYGFMLVNDYLVVVDYEDVDELLVDVSSYFNEPEKISQMNKAFDDSCTSEEKCAPVYSYAFDCPEYISRRVIELARAVVLRRLGISLDNDNNAKNENYVPSKTQLSS